jgi:hypothetical protein
VTEFTPWQEHEPPEHHGEEARYVGTVGERELRALAGDDGAEYLEPEFVPPLFLWDAL